MLLLDPAKVPIVVAEFVEKHVIPNATNVNQQAMAWGAVWLANRRTMSLMQDPKTMAALGFAGFIGPNGQLLLDDAYQMAKFVIGKTKTFSVGFYHLDEPDIEKLYGIAKGLAENLPDPPVS